MPVNIFIEIGSGLQMGCRKPGFPTGVLKSRRPPAHLKATAGGKSLDINDDFYRAL